MYRLCRVCSSPISLLGIPSHKIVVHVKRIGGGFGGKDSIRHIRLCIAVCIAALKLKQPVRLTLDRNVDMLISGPSSSFKSLYKVGFTSSGLFRALDIVLYSNGGWSQDYSVPIMERALLHCDNVYRFNNLKCYGRVCKTHTQSATAYRGFGIPQGILIVETVVEHVASYLKVEPVELRRMNLYEENDSTHFKQTLVNWHIPRMWNELVVTAEYYQRLKKIEQFNRENRYRKRGLAMNPAKLALGFTRKYMYQAGALIHIYRDGTVLLTHGGKSRLDHLRYICSGVIFQEQKWVKGCTSKLYKWQLKSCRLMSISFVSMTLLLIKFRMHHPPPVPHHQICMEVPRKMRASKSTND